MRGATKAGKQAAPSSIPDGPFADAVELVVGDTRLVASRSALDLCSPVLRDLPRDKIEIPAEFSVEQVDLFLKFIHPTGAMLTVETITLIAPVAHFFRAMPVFNLCIDWLSEQVLEQIERDRSNEEAALDAVLLLERLRPRDGDCPWGHDVLRRLVMRRVRRENSEHANADDGVKALVSQLKPETHLRMLADAAWPASLDA